MLRVLGNSDCSDLRVKPSVSLMTCRLAGTESAPSISCEMLGAVPELIGGWRIRDFSKHVAAPYYEELRHTEI